MPFPMEFESFGLSCGNAMPQHGLWRMRSEAETPKP
jgi:hypothetical protein